MNEPHTTRDETRQRMLTLRGGGGVILICLLPTVAVLIWALSGIFLTGPGQAPARSVEDFGFDLSTTLVPRDEIVVGSENRNFIRALDHPGMIKPEEVDRINDEERKYLVPSDRVIGIVMNGEARAYPLRMLDWHEVVNDTVGGVPVAVTYNGLCDSVVVFDRRVHGREVLFGVSGLLHDSNLLMFDRQPEGATESLWSQLQMRAVTGPAARRGDTLIAQPCALMPWGEWRVRHPNTLVLEQNPNPSLEKYYKRRTYSRYFATDELHFPVEPLPDDGHVLKSRVMAISVNGRWWTVDQPPPESKEASVSFDGVVVRFDRSDAGAWMTATTDEFMIPVIYAFRFAWYAARDGNIKSPELD